MEADRRNRPWNYGSTSGSLRSLCESKQGPLVAACPPVEAGLRGDAIRRRSACFATDGSLSLGPNMTDTEIDQNLEGGPQVGRVA